MSIDGLFDMFANARRRMVLTELSNRQSDVAVETLARHVAAREADATVANVPESTVESVHVSLHHVHLPKLADAEFVEYDREDRSVELLASVDQMPFAIQQ